MDMPTRNAKARIMRCDFGAPSASPRIMKKNAVAKAANTPAVARCPTPSFRRWTPFRMASFVSMPNYALTT
jgi:hypothetical protein